MTEIRIDNTGEGTCYLYNGNEMWKDYVGCENFDEEIVLFGNRQYANNTNASWYQKAKEVIINIDSYDKYPEDLSDETNAKLKELYDKCRSTADIVVDVLRLLYPNDTFETGIIKGYCQEYIVKGNVNVDLLEAYYFGKIADITVNDGKEEYGDVITHDDLWKAERNGLREYLKERYEIPEDEEIRILQANGMKQIIDWREVV